MTVKTAAKKRIVGGPVGERVDADHHCGVANQRDNRDQTEDIVPAEAERDVEELDAERDDQRPERLAEILAAQRRPDRRNRRRRIDRPARPC